MVDLLRDHAAFAYEGVGVGLDLTALFLQKTQGERPHEYEGEEGDDGENGKLPCEGEAHVSGQCGGEGAEREAESAKSGGRNFNDHQYDGGD